MFICYKTNLHLDRVEREGGAGGMDIFLFVADILNSSFYESLISTNDGMRSLNDRIMIMNDKHHSIQNGY